MKCIWALLLLAPLAAGAITTQQGVGIAASNQAPFAVLSSGDQGTATIGASGTRASVTVADSAILVADDVLDITSSSADWSVRAEYVAHTGFTGLSTTFTLSLRDGLLSTQQIRIANGVPTQSTGSLVDLPATQDTQLFAMASLLASGSVTLDLVISPDSGPDVVFRYRVVVTVT